MKSSKDYSDYLNDIIQYARKAESFLEGVSLEDFKANEEKALAVIRALEVIGEATVFQGSTTQPLNYSTI